MNLETIARALDLTPVTREDRLDREVTGCYVGDLLSCAMRNGKKGDIWLTVQSHVNVVAVAVLLDFAGVVVTEGGTVEPAALARAEAEGVVILTSPRPSYPLAGRIWELGIRPKD